MDQSIYQVSGRVTRSDNDFGIHGLCVEVWDKDHCDGDFLSSDLTNSDGSFNVCFSDTDFHESLEGNPEIFLVIKDCQCRVIHDTRNELCSCYPGKPWNLGIQLIPDVLWWHYNCSGSWVCSEDPLIPKKVTNGIEEALELPYKTGKSSHQSVQVSGAPNVRITGSFVTNTPINDPRSGPGKRSPNWDPLLQQVASLVALDQVAFPGGDWVYYGIINSGIPGNVPGCSNSSATGGLAGRPVTYAHEIGHQFGLPNSRYGNAGSGNANYPIYEPYDLPVDVPANLINTTDWTMASIGEYRLDINNGTIANPQNAEDFMSYCSPRWISLFTHNSLVNRMELTPQVIATGSGAATERVIMDDESGSTRSSRSLRPLIDILGLVEDGIFSVNSVARLETRYLVTSGQPTSFTAQLLQDGHIIASGLLHAYVSVGNRSDSKNSRGCCDECNENRLLFFRAMLDDIAPGDSLRIVDKQGEVVWERKRPNERPTLNRVRAYFDGKTGAVKLDWKLKVDSRATRDVWLRWSNNGGKFWRALTVGVMEDSVLLDPENLPSGDVQFQVMAHDGFTTILEKTNPVVIEPKAPQVTILYPTPLSRVYADQQLHLWGTASVFEGIQIPDNAYSWYLGDEPIARGCDVWMDNPGSGKHEIRLDVTHDKLIGSTSVMIEIQ